MKTHYVLILVLVFGLLAFGQIGCPQKGEAESGTQGLIVEHLLGAPPPQVSKGQAFPIMVSLENKGSYDVKAGEAAIFLEGIEPSLFSLRQTDTEKSNTLDLKRANNAASIAGGRERIIFSTGASYTGQNVDFNQPIDFVSCYFYETEVQTNLCFALEEGVVCSLDGDKLDGAIVGDAPIQITSITEERLGQNVQVKFKIENKGEGRVFAPEASCEAPELFLENSVLATLETEEPFDCKPTLTAEKSGEGRVNNIIVCKRNMRDAQDHISPVKFRLRYKYMESSETTVKVTE